MITWTDISPKEWLISCISYLLGGLLSHVTELFITGTAPLNRLIFSGVISLLLLLAIFASLSVKETISLRITTICIASFAAGTMCITGTEITVMYFLALAILSVPLLLAVYLFVRKCKVKDLDTNSTE